MGGRLNVKALGGRVISAVLRSTNKQLFILRSTVTSQKFTQLAIVAIIIIITHRHPFNSPLSRTTWMSRQPAHSD